jgi:hypothetical protein
MPHYQGLTPLDPLPLQGYKGKENYQKTILNLECLDENIV